MTMDPTTAYQEMSQALKDQHFDTARERALRLRDWLGRGGLYPPQYSKVEVDGSLANVLRCTAFLGRMGPAEGAADPNDDPRAISQTKTTTNLRTGTDKSYPARPPLNGHSLEAPSTSLPINQVLHGDCQRLLRRLPEASVDMVLTDPPYLARYRDRDGRTVANDDNSRWVYPAFAELFRVLKPNRYCVTFYGWSKIDRMFAAWREIGFHPVGHFVWVKRYASYTRFTRMMHEQAYLLAKGNPDLPRDPPADVMEWEYTGNQLHATQKPVSGLLPLIVAYTQPGEIVLDSFAGSGSTGVAARQCNRRYILMEQDAAIHRVAVQRLNPQGPAAPVL